MKIIKRIILILMIVFIYNDTVFASAFEPTINMDTEINDGYISIVLGFKGTEVMALTNNLVFDEKLLVLEDITALEDFVVTRGDNIQEKKYTSVKILADSDYAFLDTNYAVVTFKLTDNFKIKDKTRIFFENYEVTGLDKIKKRDKGFLLTVTRDSKSSVLFLMGDITDRTNLELWFEDNILKIGLIILGVLAIFIIIINLPKKKKGVSPEKKINEQIKTVYQVETPSEQIKFNQSEIKEAEIFEEKVIDPFNMKLSENQQNETIKETIKEEQTVDPGFVELEDEEKKSDDLVIFQPVFEDGEKDDDHNIEVLSIIIIALLTLSFSKINVFANDFVEVRNCIVGISSVGDTTDLNKDRICDVLDILETKNLENVVINTENEYGNNFKPIYQKDPGGNGSHLITTTKKTNNTNNNQQTTTTSKKNDSTTTTTKSNGSKKYNVNIKYANATADKTSLNVNSGSSATFTVIPKTGYEFKTVSCTNNQKASYNTYKKTLNLSKVTADTTCTLTIDIRTLSLTVDVQNGSSSKNLTTTYGKEIVVNISPYRGYEFNRMNCNSSNVKYTNNLLKTGVMKDNINCQIYFTPRKFEYLRIEGSGSLTPSKIYAGENFYFQGGRTYQFSYDSFDLYRRLECDRQSNDFKRSFNGKFYQYIFSVTLGDEAHCIFYT